MLMLSQGFHREIHFPQSYTEVVGLLQGSICASTCSSYPPSRMCCAALTSALVLWAQSLEPQILHLCS